MVNFFNTTGGIPMVFGGLTPAGLTQVSGETATGSQQTTFNAMNQFMGVMTDPFIAGRGDPVSGGGNPNAYADERSAGLCRASASAPKRARRLCRDLHQGAAARANLRAALERVGGGLWRIADHRRQYGRSDRTTRRSSIYGVAVGADYRFSPNTLAGFALAGGGTNFSVNGAGSGRSDLFQAGAFIRHNVGAGLSHRRAGLWLAGHHHRSHGDGCRHRPAARAVQRQRVVRPRRRRLSLRRPTAWWLAHALRRRTVHDVRTAGLCRAGDRRRQHLCARLRRQERHQHPQRTRPAHRQILRDAERHPDPARPRRLGA